MRNTNEVLKEIERKDKYLLKEREYLKTEALNMQNELKELEDRGEKDTDKWNDIKSRHTITMENIIRLNAMMDAYYYIEKYIKREV